jgi:hypothetical protein
VRVRLDEPQGRPQPAPARARRCAGLIICRARGVRARVDPSGVRALTLRTPPGKPQRHSCGRKSPLAPTRTSGDAARRPPVPCHSPIPRSSLLPPRRSPILQRASSESAPPPQLPPALRARVDRGEALLRAAPRHSALPRAALPRCPTPRPRVPPRLAPVCAAPRLAGAAPPCAAWLSAALRVARRVGH